MTFLIEPFERFMPRLKPLALNSDVGFFTFGGRLYIKRLADFQTLDTVSLPLPKLPSLLEQSKFLTRLLRLGVGCGVVWEDHVYLASRGYILSVRVEHNKLYAPSIETSLRVGRCPLNLTVIEGIEGFEDGVYYGEYFSNHACKPVGIVRRNRLGEWTRVFEFKTGEINHIHNIVPDPIRNCVWVLTGDFGSCAAIWKATNNFEYMEPIARGSQQFRACVAFPLPEGLLYATDSQLEVNSINLLEETDTCWSRRTIRNVNGPVIHGARVGEAFVFSTSTEPDKQNGSLLNSLLDTNPGPGIQRNESHIVVGSLQLGFEILLVRDKDKLSYRLFQFGNIQFPSGESSDGNLYIYSVANRGPSMGTEVFVLSNTAEFKGMSKHI